ncbi:alpha/beta-type small acid-soluble spore protein [Paenibacillus taiwanensis]|uniref:alpha/beta-type small acid-soluble spore protein n=1 Tax=Paenibacillus taiwanensis TaxID=401638 RepID=UPI0003FD606E|nr:alpha/beta-type small acid-soluble spore protein [Paenibacillus taiwanensis]
MSRNKLVPASKAALYQMKYEIAAELGLPVTYKSSPSGYGDTEFGTEFGELSHSSSYTGGRENWGHLSSRDAGSIGGEITKRLISQAEQSVGSLI